MTARRAILEVALCSSYPTQILVATVLAAFGGRGLDADGTLNAPFVIAVSVGDAVLVVTLIAAFMWRSGESLAATFVTGRPVGRDVLLGIGLAPLVLIGVSVTVAALRALLPQLHNVPENPMGTLMRDPALAAVFAVVVVLAGGVREELQRGFQLHRLTGHVCGPGLALLLTSAAFGAGHTLQGYDVAVATGLLGAGWGLLYLTRRSIVAAAVSHGVFNLAQVVIAATFAAAGG
ncbi:MAG: CPBP family glutamic-type intramembrane protease [Vicinamibacterales bacterium]